jgi:hypothetical protein
MSMAILIYRLTEWHETFYPYTIALFVVCNSLQVAMTTHYITWILLRTRVGTEWLAQA